MGTRATLIIDKSSPIDYLVTRTNDKRECAQGMKLLVILPGKVASRNFTYAALREGVPSTAFETNTLNGLALDILDPHRRKGTRIIQRSELIPHIVETVKHDEDGRLRFFSSIPLENEDVQVALADEFDEYLRCCDGASLHEFLAERASKLEDPFAKQNSVLSVEAFRTLEESLLKRISSLGSSVFLSRSHLLRKARELSSSPCEHITGRIGELLISSISVFDASALRFIARLAEIGGSKENGFNVRVFQASGTYSRLTARLSQADVQFREEGQRESPKCPSAAAILEGKADEPPVFVAAPDRRREVEAIAREIHKLLLRGVHPSEILMVARDSSKYLDLVEEILPAYGVAYHVQTRRSYTQLCPYRLTKATLDLIAKVSESAELDWSDITDPLRLGFCLPGSRSGWPLGEKLFIYLEDSLSVIQHVMKAKRITRYLSEWRKMLSERLRWRHPRDILIKFIDWIEKQANSPPKEPEDAKRFLSNVIGTYMYDQSVWNRESISPRIMHPARFVVADLHPTWFATQIRSELTELETYLKDCVQTLELNVSWRTVGEAFTEVFAGKTYGLPEQDATAVRMVDAGNAAFLECKHLFLMGLRTSEFPRECPRGSFLPEQLRKALDQPEKGESAYLYLRGAASDYDNEIDFLEHTLRTCVEKVTCSMPYLDEAGHIREWSAFVDELRPDKDEKNRIQPSDWLPVPARTGWKQVAEESPPWVRQRLFCYHAKRAFPSVPPSIDNKGIQEIASTLDPDFFSGMLSSRIDRYIDPPKRIAVSHDEPWFEACSLQSIIGAPLRVHEMDIHAVCPLQLYFYQFLYLWDRDRIDRDRIPAYSKGPHWKFGRLPRRLSYIYPSNQINDTIARVLGAWPNRRGDLGSIARPQELRQAMALILDGFDLVRFGRTIEDEWHLVKQEVRDNVRREWSWLPKGTRTKLPLGGNDETEILLPYHRVDLLQGCSLILVYVNFSHQLEHLVYDKTKNGSEYLLEKILDPLRDYQLPLLLTHYHKKGQVAGGIYVELFDGARRGYYNQPLLSKHKGNSGYAEELRVPFGKYPGSLAQILKQHEWGNFLQKLEVAIAARAKSMLPKPDIDFSASPSEAACERCVYDTLCQIPRTEGF